MQTSCPSRVLTGIAAAALLAGPSLVAAQSLAPRGTIEASQAVEQKALENVEAADGFNVTLFAAPPYAMYPTCITAAPDRVLFVCTDPNLSLSREKNRGRIVRLVDEDGDGHADSYTVFVDGIDSPRGIVWDGKVLYVMHPPTLTAYYDDDGDGVADRSTDLVHGLGRDLDFRGADHGTNGMQMGIDGWLYIAVGDYGYRKAIGRDGTQIEHHGGSVVRVRPDGTGLEIYAVGTRNIYDVAIDPFLHVFTRDNTNDGDGWNTRLHYLAWNADMGYPMLYLHFDDEHFPSLFDYGSGSGTGDLWIQDPGFPDGYNNNLFTADWTVSKVFRHPLEPKGASYSVQQEEVLSVVHPSDLTMDGNSNLYVSSLSGGTFTYQGDTVGYVLRVNYPGRDASKAPDFASASRSELLDILTSPNAEHRLHAQEELLRRGADDESIQRLEDVIVSEEQPAYARVAAMFTLKQLIGARANATLLKAVNASDAHVRALALRALVDRKDELAGVPTAPFVAALSDADAAVQLHAINGLVRLGARDQADAIVPLTGSSDPALAFIAQNALVKLDAPEAALRGLDSGTPAVKAGVLRALERMHDEATVAALVDRYKSASDATTRREILLALARLDNREGIWLGDWWTTRPSFLGPYFEPSAWAGSARIQPVLANALAGATGSDFSELVDAFVLNRVLPQGAKPLLMALTTTHDSRRTEAIRALVGYPEINPASLPLLADLDGENATLHSAVAQLIVAEPNPSLALMPMMSTIALDADLGPDVRGSALRVISDAASLPEAIDVFSHFNPGANSDPDLDRAWRRFVGSRDRAQQASDFIAVARDESGPKRLLAYAVLVQLARARGVPADVKTQVTGAINAGWNDANAAPDLARAVTIMHVEDEYTTQMARFGSTAGK